MAFTNKLLASGQLTNSKSTILTSTGVTSLIHNIWLFNSTAGTVVVKGYRDNGTERQIFEYTILTKATVEIPIPAEGWILEDTHKFLMESDTATSVNYFVDGCTLPSEEWSTTTSIDFSGATRYANLGTTACRFERTDPFSISLWIKNNSATNQMLFTNFSGLTDTPPAAGVALQLQSSGKLNFSLNSSWGTSTISVDSSSSILSSSWQHLLVTYSGSSLASGVVIFQNGGLLSLASPIYDNLTTTIVTSIGPCVIGYWIGLPGRPVSGLMCEMSIFDAALSATDATNLYNGGVPGNIELLDCYQSIRHWWRLGNGDQDTVFFDRMNSRSAITTNITTAQFSSDVPA